MRRRHVELQRLDKHGQAWCLAFGQVQDEPCESRGIDDRVLERALQSAPDQPRVERVVAVLDEHGALGEAQEGSPGVLELGRADQHRAVDVMPLAGVGIDGRAGVDQRVEEGQCGLQRETLGPDLEDQEGRIAGGLHIEGDELCLVERGLAAALARVDCDLLPGDERGGAARLEVERTRAHLAIASARLAHAISSALSARRRSTATA